MDLFPTSYIFVRVDCFTFPYLGITHRELFNLKLEFLFRDSRRAALTRADLEPEELAALGGEVEALPVAKGVDCGGVAFALGRDQERAVKGVEESELRLGALGEEGGRGQQRHLHQGREDEGEAREEAADAHFGQRPLQNAPPGEERVDGHLEHWDQHHDQQRIHHLHLVWLHRETAADRTVHPSGLESPPRTL